MKSVNPVVEKVKVKSFNEYSLPSPSLTPTSPGPSRSSTPTIFSEVITPRPGSIPSSPLMLTDPVTIFETTTVEPQSIPLPESPIFNLKNQIIDDVVWFLGYDESVLNEEFYSKIDILVDNVINEPRLENESLEDVYFRVRDDMFA